MGDFWEAGYVKFIKKVRKKACFQMKTSLFASQNGGDKRHRTADLLNAIQALSQLSYTPIFTSACVPHKPLLYDTTDWEKVKRESEKILIFLPEGKTAGRACGGLCFLDEFLFASGAGDGDFSLASGDAHQLLAFGAFKIPVFPVFDAVH